MEVRIYKGEGDNRTLLVRKTRPDENPTRVFRQVKRADLKDAIRTAVLEVAPATPLDQIPLPSQ